MENKNNKYVILGSFKLLEAGNFSQFFLFDFGRVMYS